MKRWSLPRLLATLAAGLLIWAALASTGLLVGSAGNIGWPGTSFGIRLETVLMASLVGAALASAGVAYQAILRNPLADPYLLGVSSGASLMAYLWQFPSLSGVVMVASLAALGHQVFAFAGAIAAVVIVFVLASRRGRLEPITLLLVGVIVNAVNGSLFLLVNALNQNMPASGGPLTFLVGGLRMNIPTLSVRLAAGVVGIGWLILMSISGPLNVATVGDAEAQSLGVRIHRLRWVALITASLITASAVAISGPIGFIGLVCPHLGRLIVGQDQRRLLPVATALGAGLLVIADAASRLLARQEYAQTTLPVGVLTGLMGGPFFLFLLWQSRRKPSQPGEVVA